MTRLLPIYMLGVAGMALAMAQTPPASAQNSAPQGAGTPDAAAAAPQAGLAEIVVTAQRRSERLQDVPISVSVADSKALAAAHVENLSDLQAIVPDLIVADGFGAVETFVRGLGNPSTLVGDEPTVPVFIDGVYYPRLLPVELQLNNVERVEVLKGPQGTLFGRNSTGGLINIITADPSFAPGGELELGYGNYGTTTGSGYLTAGLSDNVAADLAVNFSNQGKGWGHDITTGQDVRAENDYLLRSKWLFKFDENTKLILIGDDSHSTGNVSVIAGDPPSGASFGNQPGLPNAVYPHLPGFYDIYDNVMPSETYTSYGFSGQLVHHFGGAVFRSISAYRKGTSQGQTDLDNTPLNYGIALQNTEDRSVSEELQLASPGGGNLDWTAGLYYFNYRDGFTPDWVYGAQFGGGALGVYAQQSTKSYAGYGQASYHLPEGTTITGGLRYTRDDLEGTGHNDFASFSTQVVPTFTTLGPGSVETASAHSGRLTWRAAIDQKLGEDAMAYGSVSTGYKAGVFNTLPFVPFAGGAPEPALKPETVVAYEVGVKSMLFDRRLRLNVAGFWYDLSNAQVSQAINANGIASVYVTNAASARSRGVELDGGFRATDHLTLEFGATYDEAKYRDFPGTPKSVPNTQLVAGTFNGQPASFVPGCSLPVRTNLNPANGGSTEFCSSDGQGNYLPNSPKLTLNFGANYSVDVGTGKLNINGNLSFNDGFFWASDNVARQPSFALLSSSVRYTFKNNMFVEAWGKNLLNKEYYSDVAELGGPTSNPTLPAPPRTYGGTFGVSF